MMKSRFSATALLLVSCIFAGVSISATAAPVVPLKDKPFYWGVGYTWVTYSEEGWGGEDVSLGAVTGRFGYQFSDVFSAEARYLHGMRNDSIGNVSVDLDQVYGIFLRANLLTDINFSPYVILGYSEGEATGTIGTLQATQKEDDYSLGLGADFCREFHPVCAHVEYVSYVSLDTFDASAVTVGFKIDF